MSQLTDDQLLERFAQTGDAEAFGGLIQRHSSLVHATCRRETGDDALAEDAAQAVFLLLARKARGLRGERSLASWLFATSRLTARNVIREERRRRAREERAYAHTQRPMKPERAENGEAIESHLNAALARLRPADRQAVLLRYMEGRSLAEVAAELNLAEDAARMRVTRAIERLRSNLGRAGVTATGLALVAHLERDASTAVPIILTPSAASLPSLTKGIALTMATFTTKSLIAAGIVTLVVGGGFIAAQTSNGRTDEATIRTAFRSLEGHWKGTATRMRAPGQSDALPADFKFESLDENRKMRITLRFPTEGRGERKTVTFDKKSGHLFVDGNGPREEYDVTHLDPFDKGEGNLTFKGRNEIEAKMQEMEVSLTIKKQRLTMRQSVLDINTGEARSAESVMERVK